MTDPFAPVQPDEQEVTGRAQALTLFELNSLVHAVLKHTLAPSYWLKAEISELRVASNGHCYLELVQKDERSGSLRAKARANIWRNNYVMLSRLFERATGQTLAAGIKVLVEVEVSFHELYGYSLQILDIDPTYTLGDLAQRRAAILCQLEEDGVIDLNKELTLPRVVSRIAIISSATAAGYGDFCNQLQQSGYAFTTKLFAATMQGDRVEESVIAALNAIAAEQDRWDVVVIIRGGGAVTDLGGFDSYLLAANVAQFPLPVLTGIGHERDDTIIDRVAHTRFKTPTAVAAFLIENRAGETALLDDLRQRLIAAVQRQLQDDRAGLDRLVQDLRLAAVRNTTAQRQRFEAMAHSYQLAATRFVSRQRQQQALLGAKLRVLAQTSLDREAARRDALFQRLRSLPPQWLHREDERLANLARSIRLAGPERILALGFTITLRDGRPVSRADELRQGDLLVTRFADGQRQSVVIEPQSTETKQ